MKILCCVLAFVLGVSDAVAANAPALEPFAVDWNGSPDSPASAAFLLDAPAGKDGFIRVADGHMVRPGKGRFRIWGVNATAKACLPSKNDAPQVAAQLARFGLNCVRFHFLDSVAPHGLIAAGGNDSQTLDPDSLDRLDFFIAQLKARGIYADLNLNVYRTYRAGDGVPDWELLGIGKGVTYFDPRLIALQKDYARKLLTHRNPYTGQAYGAEPAVALVELVNENSLVEAWIHGRLQGHNTHKDNGTWSDIPASYEQELTQLYNQWLAGHLTGEALAHLRQAAGVEQGPIPRLGPKEFDKASAERFGTEAEFYMDLERGFFQEMARFLRQDLGVHALLLATADHNHGKSGYPLLTATSLLDVVDGHDYWQHPKYLEDPATGKRKGFEIRNTPIVNDPAHSTVVELARSAVAGKPYTVSEINHPFPSEYACEGIPLLAAYAALQDWDGIFWYTLAHDDVTAASTRPLGHFDLAPDPVKMTQLAAGAILFQRADVRPATQVVGRSYAHPQVVESLRLSWKDGPFFTPGFPLTLPLVHGTRITSLAGEPNGKWDYTAPDPLRSDTGEITWQGAAAKQGLVVIDTARSQALIGFCQAHSDTATKNLAAQVQNSFCAITLSALDDQPIAHSARLLLTATGRVANSQQVWNAARTSLETWGKPPAQIEVIRGTITLRGLDGSSAATLQPLDGGGHPLGSGSTGVKTDRGWTFTIGERPSTQYVITVDY